MNGLFSTAEACLVGLVLQGDGADGCELIRIERAENILSKAEKEKYSFDFV